MDFPNQIKDPLVVYFFKYAANHYGLSLDRLADYKFLLIIFLM